MPRGGEGMHEAYVFTRGKHKAQSSHLPPLESMVCGYKFGKKSHLLYRLSSPSDRGRVHAHCARVVGSRQRRAGAPAQAAGARPRVPDAQTQNKL